MGMSSILPKKLAIGAIGIYRGANIATLKILHVDVFIYVLV